MTRKLILVVVLMSWMCSLGYLYGKYFGPNYMGDESSNALLVYLRNSSGRKNTFEKLNSNTDADPHQQVGCRVSVPIPDCTCTRTLLVPETDLCHSDNSVLTLQKITQRYGSSTCNNLATLRGSNQSVVSLSLSGTFPGEYFAGARILAERVKSVYPGWVLRLYHHLDRKQKDQREWLCSMLCDYPHVDACPVGNLTVLGDIRQSAVTVQRFSVVGDPLISRYAIRDADSPILQREVDAVSDWVKSGKCYHIMRDNFCHSVPMMGGMWGGCNWWHREEAIKAREQLLQTRVASSDQPSLSRWIWPLFQKNGISHDSYTCKRFNALPFPSERFNFTFIGQRTYRSKHVLDRVWKKCPLECRPQEHKDWEYC